MERRRALTALGSVLVATTAGCSELTNGSTADASEDQPAQNASSSSEDNDIRTVEGGDEEQNARPQRHEVYIRNTESDRDVTVNIHTTRLTERTYTFESTVELAPGEQVSYMDATPDLGSYRVGVELPESGVEEATDFDSEPHNSLTIRVGQDSINVLEIVTDADAYLTPSTNATRETRHK